MERSGAPRGDWMQAIDVKRLWAAGLTALAILVLGSFCMQVQSAWYRELVKPALHLRPVAFVFAWSAPYPLWAFGFYRALLSKDVGVRAASVVYGINGALGALWPFMFFRLRLIEVSVFALVALVVSTAMLIRVTLRAGRPAALLQVPYLLWLLYLTALNYTIAMLN